MRQYFPSPEQFQAIAKEGFELIPVYRQLLADRLTPVSAFEVLGRDAHAFLLESVVGGEKIGRYSFIATAPSLVYQATMGRATISRARSSPFERQEEFSTSDPLADLERI